MPFIANNELERALQKAVNAPSALPDFYRLLLDSDLLVLGAAQGANIVPLYLVARSVLRVNVEPGDIKIMAGALSLLGLVGALTLTEFGTTYYDNVMCLFVFSGLAIVIVNRDALRRGPPLQAALVAGIGGLSPAWRWA